MPDDVFRWVIAIGVGLAALAFLAQAAFVLAIYKVARRTEDKVTPLAERAAPILENARQIVVENRPRITEISSEAVEIARNARRQVIQIGELVDDTAARAKMRIAQLDHTVDQTVVQVEHVGGAVKGAVLKPVREWNAVMAGIKAALVTYAQGGRRPSVDHATQDEEMFI
jgi:hypothetical protein